MAYLNLASIRLCTESEGPGKRLAVWVQGCERRCPGCCNIEMQEIRKNTIVEASDLVDVIRKAKDETGIEGISLIGGEPMLQAEGLSEVAKWVRDNGLTVLVFTGFLLEELRELRNESVNRLLNHTDILVDGPFIESLYDMQRDWVGSSNQKVWFLSNAYPAGIEYQNKEHQMEILVSVKEILINGWPYA